MGQKQCNKGNGPNGSIFILFFRIDPHSIFFINIFISINKTNTGSHCLLWYLWGFGYHNQSDNTEVTRPTSLSRPGMKFVSVENKVRQAFIYSFIYPFCIICVTLKILPKFYYLIVFYHDKNIDIYNTFAFTYTYTYLYMHAS